MIKTDIKENIGLLPSLLLVCFLICVIHGSLRSFLFVVFFFSIINIGDRQTLKSRRKHSGG